MKALKKEITQLKELLKNPTKIQTPQEKGKDQGVIDALTNKIRTSVIEKLHEEKLYFTHADVSAWKAGRRHPDKSIKTKVMNYSTAKDG